MGNTNERTTPSTIFMDTTMINKNAPIGVFDSGSGGLTVLCVLQQQFPHENFVYYGDTENLPYGTKSPEQIITYTRKAFTWLQNSAQVKLIVVACNTSSALALDVIKNEFTVPIVGTIYPLLHIILNNEKYQKIGVIATPASAQSGMHKKILKTHGFTGTIHSIACPDFVPLIEAAERDTQKITTAARNYLAPFYTESLDTLIYGCTHYPLIADLITPLLPPTMHYIDPAYAIAQTVATLLNESRLSTNNTDCGITTYYCTSNSELFTRKIAIIMGINTEALHA